MVEGFALSETKLIENGFSDGTKLNPLRSDCKVN